MSIFRVSDIDIQLILYLNPFVDFFNLLTVNKYYHHIITNHDLYDYFRKLVSYNKIHNYPKTNQYDKLFINACRSNNPLRFCLITNYKINIHAHLEEAFQSVCEKGYIDVAKWLIELGDDSKYGKIDIHAYCEEAFQRACRKGHINIAKWLMDMGPINIRATTDVAFRNACQNGHHELSSWLVTLCSSYHFTVTDENKIEYFIVD